MENTLTATENGWFIVKGEVTHYGEIKEGGTVASKYEIVFYNDKNVWKLELKSLGVEDKHKMEIPKIGRPNKN